MAPSARKRGPSSAARPGHQEMYAPPQGPSRGLDNISLSILTAVFLSLIPCCIACAFYEEGERPAALALAAFDRLFRAYGALLPLIPFLTRYLASFAMHPKFLPPNGSLRHPFQDVLLHAGLQVVRALLYVLHILGQVTNVWGWALGAHSGHIFADHVFLGVAVQAGLAVELAGAAQCTRAMLRGRARGQRGEPALWLCGVTLCLAVVLLVLTSGEMYNTARYFHPPQEVVWALLFGGVLFIVPAVAIVRKHQPNVAPV